jgi:NodT family efflux transporter outer membrane factor (OMF) lipoprotein
MDTPVQRRSKGRAYFSALAVLMLGTHGCAPLPPETARAVTKPVPTIDSATQDAVHARWAQDAWPPVSWWQMLGIPELDAAVKIALADNPDLKVVAARVQQGQALVRLREAQQLPSIDARLSTTVERFSRNSIQNKFAGEEFGLILLNPLNLRYHLDFWGRDRAAVAAAVGNARALEAEMADARLLLSTNTARTYIRVAAALEKLQLAELLSQTQRDIRQVTEVRRRHGLDTATAIQAAEISVAANDQRTSTLKAETRLLRDQLAVLAGQGPDWGARAKIGALPGLASLTLPDNLPLSLLARRPDVTAARWRAEAEVQAVKVAKTSFYPDVNLTGFAGLHSVSLTDLFLHGSNLAFAIGPTIELPLFQGGRLEANLQLHEAAYDVAVETYNSTVLRAVQEVADGLARWQEHNERLRSQQGVLSAAVERLRLAQVLSTNGLNHRLQVLEAQFAVHEQRLLLKAVESDYLLAAIDVIEALGGGYRDPNMEKE